MRLASRDRGGGEDGAERGLYEPLSTEPDPAQNEGEALPLFPGAATQYRTRTRARTPPHTAPVWQCGSVAATHARTHIHIRSNPQNRSKMNLQLRLVVLWGLDVMDVMDAERRQGRQAERDRKKKNRSSFLALPRGVRAQDSVASGCVGLGLTKVFIYRWYVD